MREHQQGLDRVDPRILKPAEKNPRTHSPRQLARLQKLIGEYGFTAPVLVDEENEILAGHGRVAAAIAAGLDAVPVRRIVGLTPTQKRAYRIADNASALDAGWDDRTDWVR